jgi:hypothetical protein
MLTGCVLTDGQPLKKVIANAAEIVILTAVIRRLTTSMQR